MKRYRRNWTGLLCTLALCLCAGRAVWAQNVDVRRGLEIFRRAYPDIRFTETYDAGVQDWKVSVTIPAQTDGEAGGTVELYWAGGSLLPAGELANRDKYWPLLYEYPAVLEDPADYTPEQTERIRQFGSADNRRNGAGTPMFFFDALYSADTRGSLEAHLKKIAFLGHSATVHVRMEAPLKRVEQRIRELERTDSEVRLFIEGLKSTEAYYWRIIAGTNRKSFHSLGIAIDILPKRLGGKAIFWSWTRDKDPKNWMLTPLRDRWMPPLSVIRAFEEEGFIWGGKWVIFDNMHFEYHPELIEYNFRRTR